MLALLTTAAAAQTPPAPITDPLTDAQQAADAAEATSWHAKTATEVEPSLESWMGGEGFRRVASLYSGATWSPVGNLRQDGPRLRVIGGESLYRYGGNRYDPALDNVRWVPFTGLSQFADVLAGWQASFGATTLKAFAGWTWSNHRIGPYDPTTRIQGTATGAKGVVEIWHNWSPQLWTSLDLTAASRSAHSAYSAQLRTGWRTSGQWSVGPELAITGHSETTLQRAGLFMRFDNSIDEVTLSGGALRARGDQPSAYATMQYLRRY